MSRLANVAQGSNIGDRSAHLAFGRESLARLPSTALLAVSVVDETAPLGGRDQPSYLNQMALLETGLEPRELLAGLHAIEAARGRTRDEGERWASRTLDLDLVAIDDVRSDDPDLRLPHPGLSDRGFWQRELAELRAELARRSGR
jgi:2-amino-4-hydroxy-6-hydroxymethyldihydropteridine diphosphokinase